MILVDTSVWIDHFRTGNARLAVLISEGQIGQHPFVTGELVVGNLGTRQRTILLLRALPRIEPVDEDSLHEFLELNGLFGTGLGFVDIHLLAASSSVAGIKLWTYDKRMAEQADRLGFACYP